MNLPGGGNEEEVRSTIRRGLLVSGWRVGKLSGGPRYDSGNVGTEVGVGSGRLTVDAVEDGLEVVALARVLTVEELDELEAKRLVRELLGHLGVHFGRHDESQEELVDHL